MTINNAKELSVFYFGADMPWQELVDHGFRRRNTCFLQALVNNDNVKKVFVVRQSRRRRLLANILKRKTINTKVRDVYLSTLLPERNWIPLHKVINSLFAKFLLFVQTSKISSKNDILWVYWVQAYLFARKLNLNGKYIFDIDHNIIDDENLPEHEKERVSSILIDIAKRSKYILSASRSQIKWFEQRGYSNCLMARNGIDPQRFTKVPALPADLEKVNSPRILYVGTLSKWINTTVLLQLIKKHPEWNFVFIGGNFKTEISDQLKQQANVVLLGFKLADEVPSYMGNADVGLGMYKDVEWLDVDSMKFYEYLAAGVPVVSTDYHPFIQTDFNNLIKASNKLENLEKFIQEIISSGDEIKKDWQAKARQFVNQNTWNKRIDDVIKEF